MSAASSGDLKGKKDEEYYDRDQIKHHDEEYPPDQFQQDFQFVNFIHNDSFGKSVKRYFYKPLNRDIVAKSIISESKTVIKIKNEAKTHWKLRHSLHIVKILGVTIIKSTKNWETLICMELMDLSLNDVFNWRVETGKRIPNHVLCSIAINVVLGLFELKELQIMHRDIKPENILVNLSGQVKLGDFGDAKILDSLNDMITITGTHVYWSFERFTNVGSQESQNGYDDTSDIWSLGIILLQLITGQRPYSELGKHLCNILQVQAKAKELEMHAWTKVKEIFSQNVQDTELIEELLGFIVSCLKPKQHRPTCIQLRLGKLPSFNFHGKFFDNDFRQECVKKYVQDIPLDSLKKEDDEGIGTSSTILSLEQSIASANRGTTNYRTHMDFLLKKGTGLEKREQQIAEDEASLVEEKSNLNIQKAEFETMRTEATQQLYLKEMDLQNRSHQLAEKEARLVNQIRAMQVNPNEFRELQKFREAVVPIMRRYRQFVLSMSLFSLFCVSIIIWLIYIIVNLFNAFPLGMR